MIAIEGATGRTGRVLAEALLGAIGSLSGLGAHEPCSIAKGGQ
jgi:uncharacterized protein YbjT (DUF2867 family)